MANDYFQFKQFIVWQDKTAMKVGTDGVLLGVCVPNGHWHRILDVGAGTGLVSLMLAQRFAMTHIDAVELDKEAFEQCAENFERSPWADRLNAIHTDFNLFSASQHYDLVVSNPPWFNNSLKNPCVKRQTARHTDTLSAADLFQGVSEILDVNGLFVMIIPYLSLDEVINTAAGIGLFVQRIVSVRPKPDTEFKRAVVMFGFKPCQSVENDQLTVESNVRHSYSPQFSLLTEQFYLDK